MAYELHIERRSHELTIAEWQTAVIQLDGVRLANNDSSAVNPSTGEVISMANRDGVAEILLESGEWATCFHFVRGQISFRATATISMASDPAHIAAAKLATALGAEIVGDEGETYDWQVG
ncbi:hypothetical protein [Herbaspirillum robiniae]|uniref:Uncharacterized protein n=1 Tax=Herbaspirillum robiniae TaxID=2014887 RepID=A0A246WM16_9BURK|nr:hypothetical protein [Herbaspirillum robiniae]OWY27393.1 hypothetical protein CEJ42_20315 [Herbaspirillum robiniae]